MLPSEFDGEPCREGVAVIEVGKPLAIAALVSVLAVGSQLPLRDAQAQQAPSGPAPVPVGSPMLDVDAGAFDPTSQADVLEFLPRVVSLPAGGAIHWRINGFH